MDGCTPPTVMSPLDPEDPELEGNSSLDMAAILHL